jgi:hypothetical protein
MGSFTELNLAFTFSSKTPPEVLGAFRDHVTGNDPPALLDLDTVLGEFYADEILGSYFGDGNDLMTGLSLARQAGLWRSLPPWAPNAYWPGMPSTTMRWDTIGERWALTIRTLPKEPGEWIKAIVAPLGQWSTDGTPDDPRFAGYLIDEHTPRPVLIFSTGDGSPFRFEGELTEA